MATAVFGVPAVVRPRVRLVVGAWLLAPVVIASYALLPEVRRLLEWRSGSFGISILSVVPLAAMLLGALPLLYGGRLTQVDRRLRWLTWSWLGAFGYGLAVALLAGNRFSALYAFLDFAVPAVMGLWIASLSESPLALYERIARFSLWLATPIAIYGVVQFLTLPPWDLSWMLNVRMPSIGPAVPLEFRIFSTLNSPGPLGDFLTAVLLFNLPRLRRPSALQLAQIAACVAALGLSLVRSDWIALAVGVVCYVCLSPERMRNLAILSVIGLACTIVFVNAGAFLGTNQAQGELASRWDTLTSLGQDASYDDRVAYFGAALSAALATPTGQGLGMFGNAAQLSTGSTVVFDNGFIARFTELGYFGLALYLATLVGALRLAAAKRGAALAAGDQQTAAVAVSVLALQVALVFLDLSSDHHNGFNGLFFWLPLGLLCAGRATKAR